MDDNDLYRKKQRQTPVLKAQLEECILNREWDEIQALCNEPAIADAVRSRHIIKALENEEYDVAKLLYNVGNVESTDIKSYLLNNEKHLKFGAKNFGVFAPADLTRVAQTNIDAAKHILSYTSDLNRIKQALEKVPDLHSAVNKRLAELIGSDENTDYTSLLLCAYGEQKKCKVNPDNLNYSNITTATIMGKLSETGKLPKSYLQKLLDVFDQLDEKIQSNYIGQVNIPPETVSSIMLEVDQVKQAIKQYSAAFTISDTAQKNRTFQTKTIHALTRKAINDDCINKLSTIVKNKDSLADFSVYDMLLEALKTDNINKLDRIIDIVDREADKRPFGIIGKLQRDFFKKSDFSIDQKFNYIAKKFRDIDSYKLTVEVNLGIKLAQDGYDAYANKPLSGGISASALRHSTPLFDRKNSSICKNILLETIKTGNKTAENIYNISIRRGRINLVKKYVKQHPQKAHPTVKNIKSIASDQLTEVAHAICNEINLSLRDEEIEKIFDDVSLSHADLKAIIDLFDINIKQHGTKLYNMWKERKADEPHIYLRFLKNELNLDPEQHAVDLIANCGNKYVKKWLKNNVSDDTYAAASV